MKIYNLKFIVMCSVLIFSFINCAKHDKISEIYLSNITKPNYTGIIVIQPQKNIFGDLDNRKLYSLYNGLYTKKYSYREFIEKLINGEVEEIKNYIKSDRTFDANEKRILIEYKKNGLSFIIKKYVDCEGNSETLILRSSIEYFVVIKIMFENNYYIYFNEYRGEYTFRKTPETESKIYEVPE